MPLLAAVVFIIQACFAYHALKTGRPYWWIFIIMGFPVMGCLIYYFVEVFPNTRESTKAARAVQKAMDGISRTLEPDKELMRRIAELELNPSIDSRLSLAAECMASRMPGEAAKIYRSCLHGPYASDPHIKLALAAAELEANDPAGAKITASGLLAQHAGYKTGEAALILARAHEALGEVPAAEGAYADAIRSFSGEEARYRYAAMLRSHGQAERARALFSEIIKYSDRSPEHYRETQADWIKEARKELEAPQ
jgi:hypothetical protein